MNGYTANGQKASGDRLESLFWQMMAGNPVSGARGAGDDRIPQTPKALLSWLNTRQDAGPKPEPIVKGTAGFMVLNGLCLISLKGYRSLSGSLAFKAALKKARGIVFLVSPVTDSYQPSDACDTFINALTTWIPDLPEGKPIALQIPVAAEADPEALTHMLPRWHEKGLRLLLWQDEGGGLPRQLMWQTAKMGIWNHVYGKTLFPEECFSEAPAATEATEANESGAAVGQAAWIVNNPNIVHSFEDFTDDGSIRRDPPDPLLSYRRVTPLPGEPFVRRIPDPLLILPLLATMTPKELIRYWVAPDTSDLRVLGSQINFHFKRPSELPPGVMEEIIAMVDAGGSVDITHVRANLERAYLIGYATEDGCIVGNSSLKRPRREFVERIRNVTGLDFTRFVERGYTSVRPEYRAMGIGAKLLEGLTARAVDVKVFSIISEDNLATQKIALRNNTRKIATYFSDKVGKEMGVWMPDHMIEADWTNLT
ncbi:MAG TPA: hypothetical protein DHV36_02205 [Desulfobacteraceae bacterium]|nr:hypothetical protein [Desulfobacteraceae bacterium]